MAGQAKQRWRQHIVDTAHLLGYVLEWRDGGYVVRKPGSGYLMAMQAFSPTGRHTMWPNHRRFSFKWTAAIAALKDAGIDARTLTAPGEIRTGRSRVPEVLDRRNQLERISVRTNKATRRRR